MNDPTTEPAPRALTRTQRTWLYLFWTALGLTVFLFAIGLGLIIGWLGTLLSQDPPPAPWSSTDHPLAAVGAACLVAAAVVNFLGVRPLDKRRPLTERERRRMQRLGSARRPAPPKTNFLIILDETSVLGTMTPMASTPMTVSVNGVDTTEIVVTLPELPPIDGHQRRFAMTRDRAPQWLRHAPPGCRFHARVNLSHLEGRNGWGYVTGFVQEPADGPVTPSHGKTQDA